MRWFPLVVALLIAGGLFFSANSFSTELRTAELHASSAVLPRSDEPYPGCDADEMECAEACYRDNDDDPESERACLLECRLAIGSPEYPRFRCTDFDERTAP